MLDQHLSWSATIGQAAARRNQRFVSIGMSTVTSDSAIACTYSETRLNEREHLLDIPSEEVCYMTPPLLVTYAQVNEAFRAHTEETRSKKAASNVDRAIKEYMAHHKLLPSMLVLESSKDAADERLQSFKNAWRGGAQTCNNHCTSLRNWFRFLAGNYPGVKRCKNDPAPLPFAEALRFWRTKKSMSIPDLVEASAVSYGTIISWESNIKSPSRRSRHLVARLESSLRLEPGTLSLRCPELCAKSHETTEEIEIKRRRAGCLQKARYGYPYKDWTPRLKAEWKHLVASCSTRQHAVVRTRNGEERPERTAGGRWETDEHGEVPTAEMMLLFYSSFLGFLRLKQVDAQRATELFAADPESVAAQNRKTLLLNGVGKDEKELSLSMITNSEWVLEYFDFLAVRNAFDPDAVVGELADPASSTPARFSTTALSHAAKVMSLLKEDTGYMWQNPGYSKVLMLGAAGLNDCSYLTGTVQSLTSGTGASPEQVIKKWRKRCTKARKRIKTEIAPLLKNRAFLGSGIRRSIDKLNYILKRPSPLSDMMRALKRAKEFLPPIPVRSQFKTEDQYLRARAKVALAHQDFLMVMLQIALALRPKNIRRMKFRGEHKNLYQAEDGSWWILFRRWELKNRSMGDLKRKVPKSLWQLIEDFLENHRPFLKGPESP